MFIQCIYGMYIELYAALGIFLMTYLFALGMFEATAVQFGMDQMLEDSSDQLSTWYHWGSKLGRLLLAILIGGFLLYFSHSQFTDTGLVFYDLVAGAAAGGLCQLTIHIPCTIAGLCLLVCYKKHLNIDRISSCPWKLVGFGLVLCLIKEIADLVITVTDCVVEDFNVSECFLMYSEIQVNNTCVGYMDVFNTTAHDMVTSYHFLWLVTPFMLHGLSLPLVFMTTLT